MRLTGFIDKMFRSKDLKNPVRMKNKGQDMKKHQGWNKVIHGIAKSSTPVNVGGTFRKQRYITPLKVQQRLASQNTSVRELEIV